jgi:hypothetical protein
MALWAVRLNPGPLGPMTQWPAGSTEPAQRRAQRHPGPPQAWVVTSMRSEGRYSVDSDATSLGNGCTPAIVRSSEVTYGTETIGPADNVNP